VKTIFLCVTVLLGSAVLQDWAVSGRAAAAGLAADGGSAVLDEWGNRFVTFGAAVFENPLRTQIRTTIAQLAMFDAVNAVLGGAYCPFASRPASPPGASPEAAAIRAAYFVAVNEFPSIRPAIDSAYLSSIAAVTGLPDAIADGAAVGEAAATEVLRAREHDGRNDPDLTGYTPGSGPGVWIVTPGSTAPLVPFLRFVRPFGYDDPARFRPKPPPALDSRIYTADYNEIKDVGRITASSRTAEQSITAIFWLPSATVLWTANVRSLASSLDLLTAARFEAIGIAAVTNALLASWDAKYAYMFWRPVTAIRAGDTDDNSETAADPLWAPFLVTPGHPEYPAAHTTVGAGTLGFYAVWFDTTELALDVRGAGGLIRHYTNFSEIAAEEGNARVWGGMHWRHSTEVGTDIGSRVGRYTATHLLKPLDDFAPGASGSWRPFAAFRSPLTR
jgi:hypothetical protein